MGGLGRIAIRNWDSLLVYLSGSLKKLRTGIERNVGEKTSEQAWKEAWAKRLAHASFFCRGMS